MSEVRNCKRCNRIFTYTGYSNICSECIKQDEEDFKRVKEYLYSHPGATMYEVATNLEIPVQKLKNYLREDRLEIVGKGSNLVLDCERCGKSIRLGRYCDECNNDLKQDLKTIANKANNKNTNKGTDIKYRYRPK